MLDTLYSCEVFILPQGSFSGLFRVLSIEDSVLYTWTLPKKKGSASICAVIAGRSTKPRGFDNENENTEIRIIY